MVKLRCVTVCATYIISSNHFPESLFHDHTHTFHLADDKMGEKQLSLNEWDQSMETTAVPWCCQCPGSARVSAKATREGAGVWVCVWLAWRVWVRYTAHWSINHTGAPVRVACGTNTTHISLRRHPKSQGIPREAYLCLFNPTVTLQNLTGQRLPGKKRLHLLIGVKIHFYNCDNKL